MSKFIGRWLGFSTLTFLVIVTVSTIINNTTWLSSSLSFIVDFLRNLF